LLSATSLALSWWTVCISYPLTHAQRLVDPAPFHGLRKLSCCAVGHVQVHCQTPELRGWIDRPTYGAPQLSNPPINVPAKCSVLEDIPEEESLKRKCQRSSKCSKPDGHPGFCVGRQEGQRARNSHVRPTFIAPQQSHALSVSPCFECVSSESILTSERVATVQCISCMCCGVIQYRIELKGRARTRYRPFTCRPG
jgi:hypothetical protein